MTTDLPLPDADPADVLEQQRDVVPPDDEAPVEGPDPQDVALEADEADVAEQRIEVPDLEDDDGEP